MSADVKHSTDGENDLGGGPFAGDFDSDGFDDLIVNGYNHKVTGSLSASVYVVWGNDNFTPGDTYNLYSTADPKWTMIHGSGGQSLIEVSTLEVGDFIGTTAPDLVISARNNDKTYRDLYIIDGDELASRPNEINLSALATHQGVHLTGIHLTDETPMASGEILQIHTAVLDDLDGDGKNEIGFASSKSNGIDAEVGIVFSQSIAGLSAPFDFSANSNSVTTIDDDVSTTRFGTTIWRAGDVDGDGVQDYGIGFTDETAGREGAHIISGAGLVTPGSSLTVTEPNGRPVFTSSTSFNAAENQLETGYTPAATDPENDTVTFAINGGADADKFELVGGALKFKQAPDFDTPGSADSDNVYEVQIQASDGNGGTASQTAAITITDINENQAPTFGSSTASVSIPENTTGAFFTAAATDADSDPLTYSVIGGADGDKFEFDGNGLKFKSAPDFENPTDASSPPDNVYEVQIQADDGNGGTATQTVSVSVTNVDESTANSQFQVLKIEPKAGQIGFGYSANTLGDGSYLYDIGVGSLAGGTWAFSKIPTFSSNAPSSIGYNALISNLTIEYDLATEHKFPRGGISLGPNFVGSDDAELLLGLYASYGNRTDNGVNFLFDVDAIKKLDTNNLNVSELSGPNIHTIPGIKNLDRSGEIQSIGDFNGDNIDDIAIGLNSSDPNASIAGEVFVISGSYISSQFSISGMETEITAVASDQKFNLDGYEYRAGLGERVFATGDINSDGYSDFFTAATNSNNAPSHAKAYFVLGGPFTQSDLVGNAIPTGRGIEIMGEGSTAPSNPNTFDASNGRFGYAFTKNSNSLGDAYFAIGAQASDGQQPGSGVVYLLPEQDVVAAIVGSGSSQSIASFTNLVRLQGNELSEGFGYSLDHALDYNSDRYSDLVVGATHSSSPTTSQVGSVTVLDGEYLSQLAPGDYDPTDFPTSKAVTIFGVHTGQRFGYEVGVQDFDEDGIDDLLISAPGNLTSDPGAVYLLSGQFIQDASQGISVDTPGLIDLGVLYAQNQAPFITSGTSFNAAENQLETGYTPVATDPENDTVTFTIIGGADADKVELVGGALKFKQAPDFDTPGSADNDNVYEVQIQADDGNGGTATQSVSVTVTDVAEPNIISHFTSSTYSYGVNAVPDLDTDGMDELMIHRRGSSFVLEDSLLYGQQAIDLDTLNSDQALLITGFNTNRERDLTAAFIGDFNSDGIGDVVLGKHDSSMGGISYNGRMYFLSGASLVSQSGTVSADTAVQNGGMTIYGEKFGDYLGWTINAISDSRSGDVETSVFSASSERSVTVAASVNKGGLDEFSTADLSSVYAASGQGASINIGTIADYREEISGVSVGNGFPGRGFPVGDLNNDYVEDLMLLPRWAYQETAFVSGAELLDGNSISLNTLSDGQGYIISNAGFSPIGSFSIDKMNSDNFADAVICTNNFDEGTGITGGTIFILKSGDFFVNESTPAQWSGEGNIKLSSTQGIYLANATELPDISGDGVSEIAFGTNSNTSADKLGIYVIYSEFLSAAEGDYSLENLTADQFSFVPTSQALIDLEAGNFDTDSGPELAVTTHDGENIYVINPDNFGSWTGGDLF